MQPHHAEINIDNKREKKHVFCPKSEGGGIKSSRACTLRSRLSKLGLKSLVTRWIFEIQRKLVYCHIFVDSFCLALVFYFSFLLSKLYTYIHEEF